MRRTLVNLVLVALVFFLGLVVGRTGARRAREATAAPAAPAPLSVPALDPRWERVVPDVWIQPKTLGEAFDALRGLSGANVDVRWAALRQSNCDRDARIDVEVRLRDVTPAQVIARLFSGLEIDGYELRYWAAADGVLTISTYDDFARESVVRCYDTRDLLAESSRRLTERYTAAGGRERGPRTGGAARSGPVMPSEFEITDEAVDELTRVIEETIDPASWRLAGGMIGHIREYGGRLIIVQVPENHRRIEDLLRMLRTPPPSTARPGIPTGN